MDDTGVMRDLEPGRDADGDVDGVHQPHAVTRDRRVKRSALDEFHDERVRRTRIGAFFPAVDASDVRTVEGREQLRFAAESRDAVGTRQEDLREDLDGHVTIQPLIPRAIDLPHTADPQRPDDLVGADANARGERHGEWPDYKPAGPEDELVAGTTPRRLRGISDNDSREGNYPTLLVTP
jgi:hypothetical protein